MKKTKIQNSKIFPSPAPMWKLHVWAIFHVFNLNLLKCFKIIFLAFLGWKKYIFIFKWMKFNDSRCGVVKSTTFRVILHNHSEWCYRWTSRVEVKVDGPGGKWTVKVGESRRSKRQKVDGPQTESGRSETTESGRSKVWKWTVQRIQCGRSETTMCTVKKMSNWKTWKWTVSDCVGGQKGVKVDGPQKCVGNWKTWKWTVSDYVGGNKG